MKAMSMKHSLARLRDDVRLELTYRDETPCGSMTSNAIERRLQACLQPLVAPLVRAQWRAVDHAAVHRRAMQADALGAFYVDAQTLRDDVLYPDPRRVTPARLQVHGTQRPSCSVALPPALVSSLAAWIGALQHGCARPADAHAAALFDALDAAGALARDELAGAGATRLAEPAGALATFVGHACVRAGSRRTPVLVDPFFPAWAARGTDAYRPLSLRQLAPRAVLITHSHPDHFDPGTLLRLGADCPIVVPQVERESVLSIDMAARLRELGFRRVIATAWNTRLTIGDVTIHVLPFRGEQPGTGARLHAGVRNHGNLYVVEGDGRRVAVAADAGWDSDGDVRADAARFRRTRGAVDAVFCGYRAWSTFAAQLLCSSVRRYALFMPGHEWTRRHQLMAGAGEALDVAETFGARVLVPYADGGAPWFWNLGLGPDLSVPGGGDPCFDPPPESVVFAARHRSSWGDVPVASPVEVCVLRPGQSLVHVAGGAGAAFGPFEHAGHRWPYADTAQPADAAREIAFARKKALLRILARTVAPQMGIVVGAREAQALGDHLRRETGLLRSETMRHWLGRNNLSVGQFGELMTEWARCNALEHHFAAEIERLLPGQLALHSMPRAAGTCARQT